MEWTLDEALRAVRSVVTRHGTTEEQQAADDLAAHVAVLRIELARAQDNASEAASNLARYQAENTRPQ